MNSKQCTAHGTRYAAWHRWICYSHSLQITHHKLSEFGTSPRIPAYKGPQEKEKNIFYWSRVIHCCYIITVLVTSSDAVHPSYHQGFTRSKAALIRSIQHHLFFFPCTCMQATVMAWPTLNAKEARTHCCKLHFSTSNKRFNTLQLEFDKSGASVFSLVANVSATTLARRRENTNCSCRISGQRALLRRERRCRVSSNSRL